MGVSDFFVGEIAAELLKQLFTISRKSCLCKSSAAQLITYIEELLPIIQEIKYSGVELSAFRQSQLDRLSGTLNQGRELANKVLTSPRWNVYKNLQLARKMERLEKTVSRFLQGPMQAHMVADVHHMRFETDERFDRLEGTARRIEQGLEQRLCAMKIGMVGDGWGGGWEKHAVRREEELMPMETFFENSLMGLELGKKKVKEMLIGRHENGGVVAISGMGGSGKTTLATELCRDEEVRNYYKNRILFLTVSQSPNVEQLRAKISRFLFGNEAIGSLYAVPQWNVQLTSSNGSRNLVVLDDVWSPLVLEQLIFKTTGCKTLFVSRFKFPTIVNDATYEVELLGDDYAISLFCLSAFGQKFIPPAANESLVKQIVDECKGLPLALKVIGASLHGKPEQCWESARKKLLRGEAICGVHESKLLERMAISVEHLKDKVRECFLDLGSFPEDKKIPLDVLINMWSELHDLDGEDAFTTLLELSEKNLLTIVKDSRAGDLYTGYHEIFVTQHDVLRDLAIYLSNHGNINERKRLLMCKRDKALPKEWERHADSPFNARIVSVYTEEMKEMDWFPMEFPKAEVLILNFSSKEYFLPPFLDYMPKLKALIIINHGTLNSSLGNCSVFSNLLKLRSLWLEKVWVPQFSSSPLRNLRKISLILCKLNNSFDQSVEELPCIFPCLEELTIDHCDDLVELPSSICDMSSLDCLSISNCHNLRELPSNIGKLKRVEILRLYACPTLKAIPEGIRELVLLKYLDVSQCINLAHLPEDIGCLTRLEKIDMRECPQIQRLPRSAALLRSLRRVICDDGVSWLWKDLEKTIRGFHVQIAEKCFSLDWLDE